MPSYIILEKLFMSAIMPTYGTPRISLERGEGVYLYSTKGDKYLDFCSGIAVSALGHGHPHLIKAIKDQAEKVLHFSNLYGIPGQERMASRLMEQTFPSTVFFCNSGAEAVECGLKVVRRYHHEQGNPDRNRVITCTNSFHGRTLATISAAKQEKHMTGFAPMLNGFDQVAFGNLNEMRGMISDQTAAILVEPIQGEGGINNATDDYLNELRQTADEFGLLLFFDEVQTGMGRTGKLFSYQWSNIKPDVLAIAKGLGGGFPVGACIASEEVSSSMAPGSHGSTFGGNPLAMAAANAVLDVVLEKGFLDHVTKVAAILHKRLAETAEAHPQVLGKVRGKGLLAGIECIGTNSDLVEKLEEKGLLTVAAGDNVVRFIPPLIIDETQIEEAISCLHQACVDLTSEGNK